MAFNTYNLELAIVKSQEQVQIYRRKARDEPRNLEWVVA